jgi:hypothetical protein
VNSKLRRILEDNVGEGSTEYYAKFVARSSSEVTRLELGWQLSVVLPQPSAVQSELSTRYNSDFRVTHRSGPVQLGAKEPMIFYMFGSYNKSIGGVM